MKEYVFENILNCNIQIKIKASYYSNAMDLLLTVTRYIEDFRLIQNGNELTPSDGGKIE